jgi:hypothetical protein
MHTAVYWCGFLGAWLLFAGPVFQASVELRAEDEASKRMHELTDGLPPPPRVSNWWWLLPPVRLILGSRRSTEYRESFLASVSEEDLELVSRFINIARGWMLVGLGALFIALKETWELAEHQEWPEYAYWILVVVMGLLTLGVIGGGAERQRRKQDRRS